MDPEMTKDLAHRLEHSSSGVLELKVVLDGLLGILEELGEFFLWEHPESYFDLRLK